MAGAELELVSKAGRHAWRRAWWLVAIQLSTTTAGVAALNYLPKKYESTTTIRVEKGQMINPLARTVAVRSEREDRLRGIREEILSRDYFEKIITRLSLASPEASQFAREELVRAMMKSTEITSRSRDADTFQVTYSGKDPKEVRDVTNLLAGIFIEESLSDKASNAGAAVKFLEGQLEVYRRKLEAAEAVLRQFEEKNVDQLPTNRAAQLSRVEQLRATLSEVQNNLRQAKIQRDVLRQQAGSPGSVSASEAAPGTVMVSNPLQAQLQEKEAELRRLLIDFSESYPDVVALRAEIGALQEELRKNPRVPAAQALPARQPSVQDALSLGQLQQAEIQVSTLTTREQQLAQELAWYEKKVQGIPEVEQELARLRRDYDVNDEIYNSFLRRLEEAKVTQELETSKQGEVFRILQAASLPLSPVSPTRLQTMLGGVVGGLALCALVIFLLAQTDSSVQSAEEAQKLLGLKVLAGIPWYEPPKAHSQRVMKAAALAVVGVLYAGGVAAFLFQELLVSLLRKGS
ncbi:MAG TPA: XrtA system polysaccharide chain length determinant [Candidatus Methanoperedens sp.]|nr:XrtA system polysaccharide chain length determinant [Candidatus Methanoperedens sp.]